MDAMSSLMRKVLEYLHNIHQGEVEVEEECCKRLNQAVFRCGNVNSEHEKILVYIDRLSNTIRGFFAHYLKSVYLFEMTFKVLAHFSKSEDEGYRARTRQLSQGIVHVSETGAPNRALSDRRFKPNRRRLGPDLS